jgi:hypothetical protein
MGLRSWKYPKVLEIENPYVDNLFVFGTEYVSVIDNQATIGSFDLIKEKVVCSSNPNYKNLGSNDFNSTDKTSDSNSKASKDQTSAKNNIN